MQNTLYEEFYIYLPGVELKFEGEDAPVVKQAYYDAKRRKLEEIELDNLTFQKARLERKLSIKMDKILYTESYFRNVL
ncbi:hypothetical protein [Enterococcus hulanensis]|uniref:hypothetical protein n=1 Tax=Enterococcus hulanensis TaxID=2559929 RepID=UPI0010F86D87|nr:hypothetical protein [Enterococcus hulanensis]